MAFFQKTILKKYQAMLPNEQFNEAWQKYQSFFCKKIAEFAIILELNGYSDCLKIG
jgi:hypothetical protein